MGIHEAVSKLERHLKKHRRTLFKKQHRGANSKKHFYLEGSFKVGTGSTQVGNLQHVTSGRRNFVRHPFLNTAAYVAPVSEQKISAPAKEAHALAAKILRKVDPNYVEGEYVTQFSLMTKSEHYVKKHTDSNDISYQYALGLGDNSGAPLRLYSSHAENSPYSDVDYSYKVVKFDGRLPHEVRVPADFKGERYSVIWYKNFDARKTTADPIFNTPKIVFEMQSPATAIEEA